MQIYSFLFKWKKNCQPNFKKKVSLQFVRTVYVCSNQLVASFEEAKKNRMSQIENELETSRLLRDWYRIHKRELPWRESSDPYIIWISEIILQQTRVAQGMDYFLRFTERFPDVASLASAEEDEVLKYWQGLGYYSRARNLHAAAKDIMERFGGIFPERYEDVISLKGIGEYTAAAIVSFVWNQPYPVVDGNVFRVLSRPVCGRYSDRYAQREKSLYGTGRLGDGPAVCRATQPGYNGIGRLAMRAAKSGLRSLSVERALRCLWGGRCADLSGETEKDQDA